MARRTIGLLVGSVALATSLSGCLLPIDAAKPTMWFTNDSGKDVVVIVEGMGVKFESVVPSGTSSPESIPKCSGTGIRVETNGGELIGRTDKQACPNWTLTINKDGSLDYVED